MKKIFITRRFPSIAVDMLKKEFIVEERQMNSSCPRGELLKRMKFVDGVLCSVADKVDKIFLESSPRLKIISNYATGLDNIDLAYAKKMDVAVYGVPNVVSESTADLTWAIFLSSLRHIPEAQQFVKDGQWRSWDPEIFRGHELFGKTFGIVGLGSVGRAVAKRALSFGLSVIFCNRSISDIKYFGEKINIRQVDFDTVIRESDYVSLHVPLTSETRGLINQTVLNKMKRSAILINTARGAVVNTEDLVEALKNGSLAAAALDVTDPEPISSDHPLLRMENCLIVPHIGTSTYECREQMAKAAAQNIINHFSIVSV